MKTRCLFFILCFGCCLFVAAQANKKISVRSDRTIKDETRFPGATILAKVNRQVVMEHEGIKIWCDQAVHYGDDKFVKAFGNVKIKQGDTLTLTSAYAEYNGNTKFAYASEKVLMETPSNTLRTDTLFFDRLRQQAYYRSGGVVKDSTSTLSSKIGRYYIKERKYTFLEDIKIVNPENTVKSKRLNYFSESGKAYLYGYSTIKSKESTLYCRRGFYDTKSKLGYAVKKARIDYENRKVFGDSIFYDGTTQFASLTNNIKVLDKGNKTVITGHYAEVFKEKDSVFITKRAVAASLQEKDSIFIHSDTLMVTGKPKERILNGFYDVRLYRKNMSGKSDSIHVDQTTGYTKMIGKPILWSQKNQMTGDTIRLVSDAKTKKLDSLIVYPNAFMAQEDTLQEGYNQIKGQLLYGLFEKNDLYQVDIDKNTETVFYQRENTGDLKLIGINKVLSSSIKLSLKKREIVDIYYFKNVDGVLYKASNVPEDTKILEGFHWRGEEQIHTKSDLFRGEAPIVLPKIKGIPVPKVENDFFDSETLRRIRENTPKSSRMLQEKKKKAKKKRSTKRKKRKKYDDPNLSRSARERDSLTVTKLQKRRKRKKR